MFSDLYKDHNTDTQYKLKSDSCNVNYY